MYTKYMATGLDRRLTNSSKINKGFSIGHESNLENYSKNQLATSGLIDCDKLRKNDSKKDNINDNLYSYDPKSDGISESSDRVIPLLTHRRNKSGSRSLKGSLSLNSSSLEGGDFVEELGRYVSEMSRNDGGPEDVWAQLQQKEADLLLAAELGKALLEKNEELMKQHERLTEQYSSKLEALEQEKHLLRRRLQATEEESEARMLELQSDVRELSSKLDQKDTNVKQSEREKTTLITELTAQNNRLTNQLKEASVQEIQLTAQLQGLKDQCSMRKTSLQDHVSSLETLKEELQITSDKKTELERRLQTALSDRDSLQQQLEEACDRVAMLERHIREQELKYQNSFTDMERLQRENTTLAERLGGGSATPIGGMTGSGVFGPRRTLLAEMETDAAGEAMGPTNSEVLHVYKQLRALCSHLRSGHDDDSGLHSDLSISSLDGGEQQQLRTGVLAEVAEDLAVLVSGLEGVRFKDMLEKLSQQLHDRDADIQAKNDLILELQTKVSVWEVELASAREEAQSARADAAGGELARDAAVCEARAARDAAHTRRTKAEADAARARVELSQTAGQLMEAVRQKIELCQQLDQWQMDMQELIEDQMRSKLSSQERKRKVADPGNAEPTRTSKILGFFQR